MEKIAGCPAGLPKRCTDSTADISLIQLLPSETLLTVCDIPIDHIDAGLPETRVFAREQYQMTVVCEPPNERSRHLLIIQNIHPSGEFQIRVQYHDLCRIIADLRQKVEQYIDAIPVVGYVAEFIQDQY